VSRGTDFITAPWLRAREVRDVRAALTAGGSPARFVGGCVRDAVISPALDPDDLDLATPERPERVMSLLAAGGIRSIPTGLSHGTVTALAGRRRFEITTLRRDVATDGRHAEVEFTSDFNEDAARRDFTINAMSCDGDGRLHDPVGGRDDLAAGRVRFVGDARRRIAEDYLRILRFFRFHARFGRDPADAAALAACAELKDGIDRLSGERVRQELWRILAGPRVISTLQLMQATGVLDRALPGNASLPVLERLIARFPEANPLLRVAALIRPATEDDIDRLADRLKLANADRDRLLALVATPPPDPEADDRLLRQAIHKLGSSLFSDLMRLGASQRGDGEQAGKALELARSWQPPRFPVGGDDLLARGIPSGPELGRLLDAVRREWQESDFTLDRAACLARLDQLLAQPGRDLTP
jgi:poly(A) polymerase